MSSHLSSCNLCRNKRGRRISSDLTNIYQDIIRTPESKRTEKINFLFDSYPVCALARIAVVYGNKDIADVMMSKFDSSHKSLPKCNYNGCLADKSDFSLWEITDAVYNYVHGEYFNASHEVSCNKINQVESLFGVSPSDYDPFTEQAMQLNKFRTPETIDLKIISPVSVWAREEAQRRMTE